MGISPITLSRYTQAGTFGHVIIGGRVKFRRDDVERYAQGLPPRLVARVDWTPNPKRQEKARAAWARRA